MLTFNLLLAAVVIFACLICNKISSKIGMPMLLVFIVLGMLFGTDGILLIAFDNYIFAEQICTIALIFIMFYGGFGTKWSTAKPVAKQAIVLSSFGTLITAGLVGIFCHLVLKIAMPESFLIGAVISSTDAASVFSILRSKKLDLKYNTASLLEIESGSNDPFSYMLTIVMLSVMKGEISGAKFAYMLFAQISYGLIFGFGIAALSLLFLKKVKLTSSGFNSIFIVAVAVVSYALPALLGGNGYLSAYITGIILGNSRLENKQELVHFFDGTTGLMQMLLFFLLGLLSFPSQLPQIAPIALCVALFLTFVARPIAVFSLLAPFKSKFKQKMLISWAGMRGAASIVFAIMTITSSTDTNNDVFHIVFFIVLFSILLQGTLIPYISKKLDMTDADGNVMRTFNDYVQENSVEYIQFTLTQEHYWVGKRIEEIHMPPDALFVLLIRNEEKMIPNGQTILLAGDRLILGGVSVDKQDQVQLIEKEVEKNDEFAGKPISQIDVNKDLIVLVKRGKEVVIPRGDTVLQEEDVMVIMEKRVLE